MSPVDQAHQTLGSRIAQYVRRRVPGADADDVAQEIWLRVHERIGSLRDDERMIPWLFRVARSVVVDHLRQRRPPAESIDDTPSAAVEEGNFNEIVAGWLPAMIETLPEPYRDALRRVEIDGVSQRDLAHALGLSASGAKSRVQRARKMLAETLAACCHVELDRRGNVIEWRNRRDCCASDAD